MEVFKNFDNIGAMAIIALLVYRLPTIIEKFNTGVQAVVTNIRETQKESLTVFKDEQEKILNLFDSKFQITQDLNRDLLLAQKDLIEAFKVEQDKVISVIDRKFEYASNGIREILGRLDRPHIEIKDGCKSE